MTVAPEIEGVPEPGAVLLKKYRVERVLGQGGMGVVISAWHAALEQRVALKFLVGDAIRQREAVERFLREARAAVKLHSEHVAKVTDVGMLETGSPYMVMEFLDGRDLGDILDDGISVPVSTAVDYVIQAIDAIAEAHARGIVHRDLKPSNLFVTRRDDGSNVIKVLDFGISKSDAFSANIDRAALTRTAAVMGSPLYMSPEQFRSSKRVDWRTDIWALGVILYELVCHEVPFIGETVGEVFEIVLQNEPTRVRDLRPDAPEGLEEVILRCLRKKPEDRYADVSELAQALAPFGSGEWDRCVHRARRLLAGKSLSRLMTEGPPSSHNAMVVGSVVTGPAPKVALSIPAAVRHTSGGWGTSASHVTPRRPRWQLVTGLGAAALLFLGGIAIVKIVDRSGPEHPAASAVDPLATEPPPKVLAAAAPAPQAISAAVQVDAGVLAPSPSEVRGSPRPTFNAEGGPGWGSRPRKSPAKAVPKPANTAADVAAAKSVDGVLDERH
ncbi:serine/threonine protein kinase [Pendulispora rubella]|uniref:Serine/threonine protein kinase n=1 Tax=Pendulispora rubella TaxID=2741070 RepID=A0ABZ2LMI6_9BACT